MPTPRIILSPGHECSPLVRHWQGIPGIERTPKGKLFCAWYTGDDGERPGNYIAVATSADDGRSWLDPALVIVPPTPAHREFDPVPWLDPLGRLWIIWSQSTALFDGKAGVWEIHTANPDAAAPTWTAPRRIANGVQMNKPTVLSNGEWLFPAAVWSHVALDAHPELAPERFSNALFTADRGESFRLRIGPDVPGRTFDEHMFVELNDHRLWCLVRTKNGIAGAASRDMGRTWSSADSLPFHAVDARFFVRRIASGRLLLVFHDASPIPHPRNRSHLTAYLSDDDGKTWPNKLLLDDRIGVSYPDGFQAPNGSIYLCYDFNRGDEHAHGADRQILLAVFTEDDIVRGARPARLRQQISKASGPIHHNHKP